MIGLDKLYPGSSPIMGGAIVVGAIFGIIFWALVWVTADTKIRLTKPYLIADDDRSTSNGQILMSFAYALFVSIMLLTAYKAVIDPPVDYRAKLQELYIEGGELENRTITSQEDLAAYKTDMAEWMFSSRRWIRENMLEAAFSKFADVSNVLPFTNPNDFNKEHQKYRNTINKHRENLQTLMENEIWHEEDI